MYSTPLCISRNLPAKQKAKKKGIPPIMIGLGHFLIKNMTL
jgi:hypothetical protein